jgi:hypothetical protein
MSKDPRITAYALGELHGRDREKFEEELAASDTLRKEVESMADLGAIFAEAPKTQERFTPTERAGILAKCIKQQRLRKLVLLPAKIFGLSAAAALMLFAGLLGLLSIGSGPSLWADGAYYPGDVNGEYLGIVSGRNTAGVVEFVVAEDALFRSKVGDVAASAFTIFHRGQERRGQFAVGIKIDEPAIQLSGLLVGAGDNLRGAISRDKPDVPLKNDVNLLESFEVELRFTRGRGPISGTGKMLVPAGDPEEITVIGSRVSPAEGKPLLLIPVP